MVCARPGGSITSGEGKGGRVGEENIFWIDDGEMLGVKVDVVEH